LEFGDPEVGESTVAMQVDGETPERSVGRRRGSGERGLDRRDERRDGGHIGHLVGGGDEVDDVQSEGLRLLEHEAGSHETGVHRMPPARTSPKPSRTATGASSSRGAKASRPTST
jgi:hypothetical protein